MATFYNNLRESNKRILDEASNMNALDRTIFLNNKKQSGELREPNSKDPNFITNLRDAWVIDIWNKPFSESEYSIIEKRGAQDLDVREEAKALREAIKQASGGRITVDKSIHDKTELNRLLEAAQKMSAYEEGALQPGYSIIKDGKTRPGISGETTKFVSRVPIAFPFFRFQFPGDNYGSKNAPYRITIKDANNTDQNDLQAVYSAYNNWTIEDSNDTDELEYYLLDEKPLRSATHVHELAHTAHDDALKKTSLPGLTMDYAEKKKRQEFIEKNPSLQRVFDIAAKNTGYTSVEDAAASISGYAASDAKKDKEEGGLDSSKERRPRYGRLAEVFAEAYTDVLLNGGNASDYSKELIRLYVEYVNNYNDTFGARSFEWEFFPNQLKGYSFIDNLRNAK